jgi:thiamine-phosphate pyrophosphorylase
MISKKRALRESRLYVVLDKETCAKRAVISIARQIRGSGSGIIQLRDNVSKKEEILKAGFVLKKLLADSKVLFIVNNYIDIAKIVDSDGFHIGQDDISMEAARSILGKDKIIGVSCHTLKQACDAQSKGADYISIGPIFPTPVKPGYKPVGTSLIEKVKKEIKIPFFAIGNINQFNIDSVISRGATRVAICRAIIEAKNIPATIKLIKKRLLNG